MNASCFNQLQIGSVHLPNNLMAAPLAGYSDLPFRRICRRFFSGLIFCEMVKMEALLRKVPATLRYLEFAAADRPIGAQLCGSKASLAASAAAFLEEMGFDVINLNCGCPVKKVIRDGSGAALLQNPELIGEILTNMQSRIRIPVTVKIRSGWDIDKINAPEIVKIAEQANAKAVIVHGRTRSAGYRGEADWEIIRQCKKAAGKIKVIGNGGLFSVQSIQDMLSFTGCDGAMLARGMIGQPWIFAEYLGSIFDKNRIQLNPGSKIDTIKETLKAHFSLIQKYRHPEDKKALCDMRRLIGWYLKFASHAKALKIAVNKAGSTAEIFALMENYAWEKMAYNKLS